MSSGELVAHAGEPDGNIPVARLRLQINPVLGVGIMDALNADPSARFDILLTDCTLDAAGMHLDRNEPGNSYVSVIAITRGVGLARP